MPPGVPMPPKISAAPEEKKDDLSGQQEGPAVQEVQTPGDGPQASEGNENDKEGSEVIQLDFVNLGSSTVMGMADAFHGVFKKGRTGSERISLLGKGAPLGFSYFHAGGKDQPLQMASRFLNIGGSWYIPELSNIRKQLTLAPYKGALGELELDLQFGKTFEVSVLVLRNEEGGLFTFGASKGLPLKVSLPVGRYRLAGASVRQVGKDKPMVDLIPKKSQVIEIAEGKEARLTLGGKFWERNLGFKSALDRELFVEEILKKRGEGGECYVIPEPFRPYHPLMGTTR